ncbi:putative homing endonuclease [uncultured Caudovirales phage]|uniref:Putative homing endonuclease n=1 Tax=uncultured Caudovirales phage TaxID=2100421 RepID=A0A2H4J989_9CAUD|nr:putative homing endonuclease [uncultured Caudovirales phage]
MAKEIPLQNDMVAIVDDEDYERVSQFNWIYHKNADTGCCVKSTVKANGKSKQVTLGYFILGITEGFVWNINRNRLDFTRENLKIVDRKFLSRMSPGRRNSTSKYKGVCWSKRDKRWLVSVQDSLRNIRIQRFCDSEDEAALVYNSIAKELYGDECYLNVIGKDNSATETQHKLSDKKPRTISRKKYKGTSWLKRDKCWVAIILNDSKPITLGYFDNEIEAARAYDQKAIELFGDKAILNFPEEVS